MIGGARGEFRAQVTLNAGRVIASRASSRIGSGHESTRPWHAAPGLLDRHRVHSLHLSSVVLASPALRHLAQVSVVDERTQRDWFRVIMSGSNHRTS